MFSRGTRVALDIKAGNPVILVPRSAKSSHMLVADLGNLTVVNGFLWEGSPGTLAYSKNRPRAQSQTDLGMFWCTMLKVNQCSSVNLSLLCFISFCRCFYVKMYWL